MTQHQQQPDKKGMSAPKPQKEADLDETIEESFPASDPPANTGTTASGGRKDMKTPSSPDVKR
ncbi:hypothetical protein [Rubinisphaera margarita]|uniref:hypothetical protein n=1 Tax=Rubinisphaera margarita TaxID=2909586 RepID=UPI001EE7FD50|nr:hypothetical protein [Rubinisphaera margarita]MCG6154550.1 hypothetical protein [Rubinisphaera margarita]